MKIVSTAAAGTLESGDIYIEIAPGDGDGIEIDLDSTVMNLYGDQIRAVIEESARAGGLEGVRISATDKGALDCTIRARVTAAALRALGTAEYAWRAD